MIFLVRTTLNKDVTFLLPPSDKAWLWQSSRLSWRPQGQGSQWRACSARPAWPCCLSPREPPKRNVNVVNLHPTNFIPTKERNDSQPSQIPPLPSRGSWTICHVWESRNDSAAGEELLKNQSFPPNSVVCLSDLQSHFAEKETNIKSIL